MATSMARPPERKRPELGSQDLKSLCLSSSLSSSVSRAIVARTYSTVDMVVDWSQAVDVVVVRVVFGFELTLADAKGPRHGECVSKLFL
jgi:hypothetical protein